MILIMKNKKIILVCLLIFLVIILNWYYKNRNSGNNISKSITDFEDYILNISSYEATISVEITSNKNTNKYIIKQWYASPNIFKQEVQAPENLKGLTILYDGTNLEIQNSRLNLTKIYNNYEYLSNNILSLNGFIEECKNGVTEYIESKEEITLGVTTKNKYTMYKKLTMDKRGIPIKLEIMNENKKNLVYILYNEITINSTTKEDII